MTLADPPSELDSVEQMAAYSTGKSWAFPGDLPHDRNQDDIDAEMPSEPAPQQHRADPYAGSPRPQETPRTRRTHYPPHTCRICLDTVLPTFHPLDGITTALPQAFQPRARVSYKSPPGEGGRMIRPCECKGSQKYVHEECLSAWRMQDPLQKRNYWQCPTCSYKYKLHRLTWGTRLTSTAAQIGLTISILVLSMFVLGFVADPIINLYLDPYDTIANAGGPTGSLLFEDEPASWGEHFIKGLASLGLLGFAKFLLTLTPWQWFNMRGAGLMGGGGRHAGTGRDRLQQISWLAVVVGVAMFLWAVWKGVRAWSRRILERAGERVMDVPHAADDDDDDDDDDDHNE